MTPKIEQWMRDAAKETTEALPLPYKTPAPAVEDMVAAIIASHAPSKEDPATWLKAARLAEQFGEIASDHGAVTANAIAAECKRRAKHPEASDPERAQEQQILFHHERASEAAAQPTEDCRLNRNPERQHP